MDSVRTITTPGASIDVVVTEAGVAVNPARDDLACMLKSAGIETVSIACLRDLAMQGAGESQRLIRPDDEAPVVALQQYRDGSIIDVVRRTY